LLVAVARQQAMNKNTEKQTPPAEIAKDAVQRAARAERLKQSLRANLHRRKGKSRAIKDEQRDDPS